MGLKHIDRVKAVPSGMVNRTERLVLFVLAAETNDSRDGWAHGYENLATMCDMAERTLRRHILSLEEAEFISRMKQKRFSDGSLGRVTIVLTVEAGIKKGEGTQPYRRTLELGRVQGAWNPEAVNE